MGGDFRFTKEEVGYGRPLKLASSRSRISRKGFAAKVKVDAKVGRLMQKSWDSRVPYDSLDDGIREAVRILVRGGIETFESCQGGQGHAYPEPTIRFYGEREAGWRALAVAQAVALEISELRRVWPVNDGEPTGPWWEITFRTTRR